jgi:hypothetical protein
MESRAQVSGAAVDSLNSGWPRNQLPASQLRDLPPLPELEDWGERLPLPRGKSGGPVEIVWFPVEDKSIETPEHVL